MLLTALGNLWRKHTRSAAEDRAFFDATDQVITALLTRLQKRLREEQQLIVLHIPAAEIFTGPNAYRAELHTRLLAIYERLNLAPIDLALELGTGLTGDQVIERYYVRRPSGSIGHLNRAAHEQIADLIQARIEVAPL